MLLTVVVVVVVVVQVQSLAPLNTSPSSCYAIHNATKTHKIFIM